MLLLRACFWPLSLTSHPTPLAVTYPGQCLSILRADHPFAAYICLSNPCGSINFWEGSLDLKKPIFCPRSKHYLPSSGSPRDCRQV